MVCNTSFRYGFSHIHLYILQKFDMNYFDVFDTLMIYLFVINKCKGN